MIRLLFAFAGFTLITQDCVDPPFNPRPSCASLGCPDSPSGSPIQWEPCTGEICYCGAPVAQACTP